jgi:hypothetical protein
MRSAGDVIAQTTRALRSVALVGSRTARHTGLMSEHVEPAPSVDRLAGLLPAVGDDRLGGPTLNERRTVGQLLQHIVGLTAAFRAAAEKDFGPWTDTSPDANGWPELEGFESGGTPGRFGPATEAPEDAGPFETALARSGRDPSWSPGV